MKLSENVFERINLAKSLKITNFKNQPKNKLLWQSRVFKERE